MFLRTRTLTRFPSTVIVFIEKSTPIVFAWLSVKFPVLKRCTIFVFPTEQSPIRTILNKKSKVSSPVCISVWELRVAIFFSDQFVRFYQIVYIFVNFVSQKFHCPKFNCHIRTYFNSSFSSLQITLPPELFESYSLQLRCGVTQYFALSLMPLGTPGYDQSVR